MAGNSMFEGFLAKAKVQSDCAKLAGKTEDGTYRHLQVRLSTRDARRFKYQADDHGLSLQDALVLAINDLMREWGQEPCRNLGTAKKRPSGK